LNSATARERCTGRAVPFRHTRKPKESSDVLLKKIVDDMKNFSGDSKQNDDVTILIVEIQD
jgi:serine phosphatase RsbU (regulator of sigma subunit)